MTNNKKIFLSFVVCFLSFVPLAVSAADVSLFPAGYWGPLVTACAPDCNTCDLFDTGQRIIYFLLTLTLFVVGPIMVVAGGIMMMVAAGNPERFSSGRKIATGAVVGILIALAAFLIVMTVIKTIATGLFGAQNGGGLTITCSAKSPYVAPTPRQNQSGLPAGMICPPSSNWIAASGRCEYGDGSSATPIQNPNGSNSYVGQQNYTDPSVPQNVNIPDGSGNVEDYTYPRDMGE